MTGREPDACKVKWCDEVGLHNRHMNYGGSWFGASPNNGRTSVVLQLWAFADVLPYVRPALTLIPASGAPQVSCELTWDEAGAVADALTAMAERFG